MSVTLEQLADKIKLLTTAINGQVEYAKHIEERLRQLEKPVIHKIEALTRPKTEQDLSDISRLPDCVKELQTFDGNPTQYVSWIHNVESILKDYEIVRDKPIFRAILQSIRQKIRGNADAALISYNIFSDDWTSIKKCLSLHYADKRDLRTLEHQLSSITQNNMSIDEFYANINHQFSLIVNKIKTEEYSSDTIEVLIETYRNRALDVFIRGLNGELSRMLIIQRPQTLPEAYTSCLEFQNLNFRNLVIQKRNFNNSVVAPINQLSMQRRPNAMFSPQRNIDYNMRAPPRDIDYNMRAPPRDIDYKMRTPQRNIEYSMPTPQRNIAYNIQHHNKSMPPPRPTEQKPATPMEIDQSIQTRQANYINRPINSNYQTTFKRDHSDMNEPRKSQRIYHLETQAEEAEEEEQYQQVVNDNADLNISEYEEENSELNFMTKASLAYHT